MFPRKPPYALRLFGEGRQSLIGVSPVYNRRAHAVDCGCLVVEVIGEVERYLAAIGYPSAVDDVATMRESTRIQNVVLTSVASAFPEAQVYSFAQTLTGSTYSFLSLVWHHFRHDPAMRAASLDLVLVRKAIAYEAAARTTRLKLGVYLSVPGRNPVRLARELANLDRLSGGRLLLIMVLGQSTTSELLAQHVTKTERGALLEEVLPLLRRLWSGDIVHHHGPRYQLRDARLSPTPVQMPLELTAWERCTEALCSAACMAQVALRDRCGDRRAATGYRASPRWAAPRRAGGHPAGGWDCSGVAGWPA